MYRLARSNTSRRHSIGTGVAQSTEFGEHELCIEADIWITYVAKTTLAERDTAFRTDATGMT